MQEISYDIIVFLITVSALIILMIAFIISMLYMYRKKQQGFEESLMQQKLDYEKSILNTQLEIQEQTFQHISREIHDNITLSLTLAKLHLHTMDWSSRERSSEKIEISIDLLSNSISELGDISKSLNANIIIQHGLIQALKEEIQRIRQADPFQIEFELTGIPVYFDAQKELIIFRIIQEAFNNIIKHANATKVKLSLHYNEKELAITINDNGIGFDIQLIGHRGHAGMRNMETRVQVLKGSMTIDSQPGRGTSLSFTIPLV